VTRYALALPTLEEIAALVRKEAVNYSRENDGKRVTVVVAVLYATAADKSAPTQQHLLNEVRNKRPLSVLMAERIAALRDWTRSRAVRRADRPLR
jgi:hypothetical protein